MAGDDTELCGFMDAKLPGSRYMSQRVMKKRPLAPWKVWRRHWCSVRRLGPGLGLEILLDHGVGSNAAAASDKDSCIRIPANVVICRTESRSKQFAFGIFPANERKAIVYLAASSESDSQRWMASLRQMLRPRRHRFMEGTFSISMVDNAHSRSAGLTGMHGDLVASKSGIFIKDVHTGDIVETFDWKETSEFHLPSCGRAEDVKRICVIHTTKEFRGGAGELRMFCLEAPRLLQGLITRGRGPRHSGGAGSHLAQRPLSLSEGDLRVAAQQEIGRLDQGFQTLKHKIAANIVNAGLGLLLTARSGSEAKLIKDIVANDGTLEKMTAKVGASHIRAVDNVYEPEPASMNNIMSSLEELEEPSTRRISNISVASGIYEEILDDFVSTRTRRVPSNLYENPEDLILNSSLKFQPPPLPPRLRCGSGSTRNESTSDDGLDSEGGTRSASPSTQDDATPTPEDKAPESSRMPLDTSDYVAMSPRLQDIALHELQQRAQQQEEVYMVMR